MPRIHTTLAGLLLMVIAGCYAPLQSPGIPASALPDTFRAPLKAHSAELNYAMLKRNTPREFRLGADDLVRIEIADLAARIRRLPAPNGVQPPQPVPYAHVAEVPVDEQGQMLLPIVGHVRVGNMTLSEARQQIAAEYAKGVLDSPRVGVTLVQSATSRVMVLGNVARPGVYDLPKYENDVAHAITMAGGLLAEQADEIQVHKRIVVQPPAPPANRAYPLQPPTQARPMSQLAVLRIPLRSLHPVVFSPNQMVLNDGDVVVVKNYPEEVFFVVGRLSPNNLVRFSQGRENRDLGNGFVLPKDRDVDVVTAVAMAGYIDPIDSPTTVTVHRVQPDGNPMLIRVDLIAARTDRRQNVMVRPGDIIYLNPDGAWWFRRTLDRVIPQLITAPYTQGISRLINPGRNN